jgi:hypothetical protein
MHIRDYKYTPEDVDCQYCVNFVRKRCGVSKCPWLNERIEAGVIDYQTAVNESFSDHSPLRQRIKMVLAFYDKSFWKDEAHFHRYQIAQAIFGYYRDRNTSGYYAALYLLTATDNLFRRTVDCFSKTQINFDRAKLRGISTEEYALYKTAKCLYTDSSEVGVDELADPDLVSTESFHLVVNAMLLSRYGPAALYLKGGASHGSFSH